MAKEKVLNLPRLCITWIMAKEATSPKPSYHPPPSLDLAVWLLYSIAMNTLTSPLPS